MSKILNIKSRGLCAPGYVFRVTCWHLVVLRVAQPTIDSGDGRSIDISCLESRHGGQCWHQLGSRLRLISNAAVLWCCCPRAVYGTDGTGSVSADSACWSLRVLSGGDEVRSLVTTFSPGHDPSCHTGEFN